MCFTFCGICVAFLNVANECRGTISSRPSVWHGELWPGLVQKMRSERSTEINSNFNWDQLRFSKFSMLHYNSEAAESMPQATTQAACWITSPLSLLSFTVFRVSEAVHGIPQKVTPWKATPETTTWFVYDSSGFLRLRLSGRNTPATFSRNFVAADMPRTLAQPRLGSWNRLRLERLVTSKTRYYV